MDKQSQLERIRSMEDAQNRVLPVIAALQEALNAYIAVLPQLKNLETYYRSPLWMQDYEDDYAGKLPAELRRGVLSEDSLYDLLCDNDRLIVAMKELIQNR